MTRTSRDRRNTLKSLSAKVTQGTYDAVVQAAGDKKPGVWIRELIETHLTRRAVEQLLMEELWALRYIVINGFPAVATADGRVGVAAAINTLIKEADQKKADKARAILEATR
jgi:hypothetical protein